LLGLVIALSLSNFICNLYPAWQVPGAYILLVMFVAVLACNPEAVKKLRWKEYAIVAGTLLFVASIVCANLLDRAAYIEAIGQTSYPGQRRDAGGYALDILFLNFQSFFYPFKEIENPCEPSGFFTVFPVSFLAGMYVWVKNKRANMMLLLLNVLSLFFLIYVTVGLPSAVARVTLMDYSMEERVVPMLAFAQMIVMIIVLNQNHLLPTKKWIGVAAGVCSVAVPLYVCLKRFPDYMTLKYTVLSSLIFFGVGYILCTQITDLGAKEMDGKGERCLFVWHRLKTLRGKRDGKRKALTRTRSIWNVDQIVRKAVPAFEISMVLIMSVSSLFVHPLMKGLDVIYSKPVAKVIREIVAKAPDAKWVTPGNTENTGFLLACGVPTLNSVNYIPNWEMYEKLDPSGAYSNIYNRYHHISLSFTEGATSMMSKGPDRVVLALSYADFEKIGVSYIFSNGSLNSNENARLTTVYDEHGIYIYKVDYSSVRPQQ
jgi:hypothetical protein